MNFGYIRKKSNIQEQYEALKEYGIDRFYEEESNKISQSPVLDDLLPTLKSGDILVIYDLYSLGRTVGQLMELFSEFNSRDICLVSISENIDTTTSTGKYIFHVLCKIAAMDRKLRIELIKEGLEASDRVGRPRIHKETIDKVISLYESNQYTVKEIIEITGISKSSFYNYVNQHMNMKKERDE